MFLPVSIIILLIVFVCIAIRQIGRIRLQIWQIMLFGALAALFTFQISLADAIKSINLDVLLFLFGMFVIGEALEESGYLSYFSYKFFRRAKNAEQLIIFILFGIGMLSAFLMNDTLAIICTPLVLLLAKQYKINPKILLLSLAFAVTIGSVPSPIGNPQNLLIAINSDMKNPFMTFFSSLLIPTLINLFFAFLLLRIFYRREFSNTKNNLSLDFEPEIKPEIKDKKLAKLAKISLILIFVLISIRVVVVSLNLNVDFRLTYIALISAMPILAFSSKRFEITKKIDWHTLIFFAAMFILMQSVWNSGFFQELINSINVNITSIPVIMAISVILSQFISNVPLVALYIPLLLQQGISTEGMIALAAGSTIAGNLSILGAASNVIIIQNAEKRAGITLTFLEFARIGIPLTIINILVYWIFI